MEEVGGALVSIALVLCAVFVPTAFLARHRRANSFAVRASQSPWRPRYPCFVSLTLCPALCAHRCSDRTRKWQGTHRCDLPCLTDWFFGGFNRGFRRVRRMATAGFVRRHDPHSPLMLLDLCGVDRLGGWLFVTTPQGFIPEQDHGYLDRRLPIAVRRRRWRGPARWSGKRRRIILDDAGRRSCARRSPGFRGATWTNAPECGGDLPGGRRSRSA